MNLNEHFIQQINDLLPGAEAGALLEAIENGEAVTSVRCNSHKGFAPPSTLEKVPWCKMGAYLSERPQFTFDPHFHAGSYYVQDASSMIIYHVIKTLVTKPVTYLDLCAAPGGKTTAALQALPQGSIVVANEVVTARAQVLRENVVKWGLDNCMVTNDTPNTLGRLVNAFDVIAADVPCSGEGMFRKDAEAVAQWSPQLVAQCAARQRVILADMWPALKPGGLLIYSTCTYNTRENEEMVDFIVGKLGASVIEIPIPDDWNIHPAIERDYPCYRFFPGMVRGEGLFVCVMRKRWNGQRGMTMVEQRTSSKRSLPVSHFSSSRPLVLSSSCPREWITGDYDIIANNGSIIAVPRNIKASLMSRNGNIHIIKDLGVEIGVVKGKKTLPSHQLALSQNLARGAFPEIDVDYHRAIAYLRGEAITIDAPRGFVLIKYENAILGFVNNLGNRANNLYPKSWRILSSHLPDKPLVGPVNNS